jgi:signal transduction histidine kinase
MRFRSRSIRAKLVALLLVPLVSLVSLWTFTTAVSVHQVWSLTQISARYTWFGAPADDLSRAVQDERRAAVAFAAAPVGQGDLVTLHRAEQATDQAAAVFTAHASDRRHLHGMSNAQRDALDGVRQEIEYIQSGRAEVEQHTVDWSQVYLSYTGAQNPFFTLRLALSNLPVGDLTRQAEDLNELVRAREYISEEDALMAGARASGSFDQAQFQEFLTASAGEQLLYQVHEAQLPAAEAQLYQQFTGGTEYVALTDLENRVSDLGETASVRDISAVTWQTTLNTSLQDLSTIDVQAAALAGAEARSYALGVISQQGIVGAVGLLAVMLSLLVSLRIGRGLIRELVGLRDSAFDLAGQRLPQVMRRLREGERLDLAAEVPLVEAGDNRGRDEIAQVGRAFNAVQRAAVEAAVEQAELRRGVAAVFVNLARRSQALLSRQLTLLDEMERRAEQPDELADLFRLDHLTTRMRRHAEGLIILSGAAPGRSWRRPVRVLDVVRAAVGEVEDYARVRVHRMPPVAVVGGAVSDVVHLLAELVENATVFSPPRTQVRIQGEEVANGFVLEIDDRGLGMGEEALAAANERLSSSGDFDLGDTDRLGLFVISRLSGRHNIRVSLRRSPYGGTTAVVLLPPDLLTAVAARSTDIRAEETSEQVLPTARMRLGRELPQGAAQLGAQSGPGGPRPVPADDDGAGGLPRRRALTPRALTSRGESSRAESYLAARESAPSAAATAAPASSAPSTPHAPAAAPTPTPGSGSGSGIGSGVVSELLPRRIRQANLAPQLREAAERRRAGDPVPEGPPARERSPEEVRATFSSYQRGLARGRGAATTPGRAERPPQPETPEPSQTGTAPAEGPV